MDCFQLFSGKGQLCLQPNWAAPQAEVVYHQCWLPYRNSKVCSGSACCWTLAGRLAPSPAHHLNSGYPLEQVSQHKRWGRVQIEGGKEVTKLGREGRDRALRRQSVVLGPGQRLSQVQSWLLANWPNFANWPNDLQNFVLLTLTCQLHSFQE